MKDAVEIARPFIEEADRQGITNIQILGGVGSIALTHPNASFSTFHKEVILNETVSLPQIREGGSKRDLDVLVQTIDQEEVDFVEAIAKDIIGDELELSFFGLKGTNQLYEIGSSPIRSTAKHWLSDRYVTLGPDGEVTDYRKAVFPIAVDVDPASLETWTLILNKQEIPIPNPASSILNYLTRSISGLRPKDKPKVEQMVENVLQKAPELREWTLEGPGSGLYNLAMILNDLRLPKNIHSSLKLGNYVLYVNEPRYGQVESAVSDFFAEFSPDLSEKAQLRALKAAKAKSQWLHSVEKNQRTVDLFQLYAEKLMGGIVKNSH